MTLFATLKDIVDEHKERERRTAERQAQVPEHIRAIVAAAPDECISEVVKVLAGLMDPKAADASLAHLQALGRKFEALAGPAQKLADMLVDAITDRLTQNGARG